MTDSSQDAPTQQPNPLLILIGINIGIKLQNAGKFKKALRCFIYALEADSSRVDIWYRIGNCWQNLGYFEDAIASYNACNQRSLVQQNIWFQAASQFCLGQCYVSLQQQDQAIIAYRLAYQLFSQFENTPYTQQSWDYLDKVGNELLNNQQFESAIQYYQSLLEVVKLVNNQQNLSSVLHSLGKVYYWQNQDELAIECHREMLEISRRLSDGEMENTALRWLTSETWRLGQMETAIDYFKQRLGVIQRLQRPQEQPEILDWIIKGYKQLNQLENTIDYYQQKLKLLREKQDFSTEYQTLYDLGGVYFSLKQYPLAIDCFQAGLNLEPSLEQPYYHANLNYMLGLIYLALNQDSEAIASFEKAVIVYEQQENSQEWVIRASEYLEKLYQQIEDFEKLIPILEKRLNRLRASQDRSNEYSLLYKIAGLYYQLKNYSQAGDYYNSALGVAQGLTPRQPGLEANAYYMLGLMCHCLQRWEEGLSNYREALRFYTELNNQEWVEHSRNKVQELERILASRSSNSIFHRYPHQIGFLLNALQAVSSSRGNPKIVYPLFQQNLDKLDENLANILTNWAMAKFKEVPLETAYNRASDISNFANLIQQFPLGSHKNNLEISIAAYQAALEVYNREAFPEQWASTQHNLAIAYCKRIKGGKADNIERAIETYQAALEIHTRETFPEDWAMTQRNLANAYGERIKGVKADNIEHAISGYQDALEVYKREAFPKQWASTQHSLATAYYKRIKGEKADNIERAIETYQAALEIRTREVFPEDWATTQHNLALAYGDRIKGRKSENIEHAIAAFQDVLEVYKREAFPEQWASTQHNLATAYYKRIKGEKADNIERAISACQATLEIYTCEAFPEDWARTQINLANAYKDRIKGKKADNIERAIAFYQAALEIYTCEAFPEQWAMTQNNLAIAYSNRIKGEKADNIKKAIASCQAALEIRTRTVFPYDYLQTSYNLGRAYQDIQQWQLAYETFDNAIETLEEIRAGIVKGGDADKQKLAEEWQKLYQRMVEVCIELKNYTAAIEYVERSKTRNLVELLATRDLYPKGDIPQTVKDELDRLRRDIETEQRRLEIEERTRNRFGDGTTGERSPNIAALQTPPPDRSRLNELRQELDDFITRDITPIDPDFRLTQKVQPIPFSDIQALTGDNTAILEWYILSDRFVVFIVTPPPLTPAYQRGEPEISEPPFLRGAGGIKLWQSTPEDYNALTAWADDYLNAYRTDKKQWQNTLNSRLQRLGEILHFDQLLNIIGEKCDSLVLIPNRFLHLFPLHALPISQQKPTIAKGGLGGSILMDLFPGGVSYAPSCQLLQTAKNRQRPDFSQLFAIQNPTKDLDYTDLEVNSICTYFNPSHILVHENAKKTTFNEQQTTLKTANCHHFSCHGYFNFENPILSALLFADCYLEPAPSPLDPSRHLRLEKGQTLDLSECLTLGDVFTLDLRCCRLVTLSACETGLIDFQSNSDEYIGLPSGFLVAGSTNVVSSLWSVSDISTAILMIRFYQLLREGEEVAIALNYAQKWLRNATKAELLAWIDPGNKMQLRQSLKEIKDHEKPFASPYYWAAFCAIGR
ncbi:CHAT domain-containing tetratricopeptide repeat protein [Planktothrix agardhii]|uniref:CHAT domain-containing tetratricopeptide repeat protein n=1 Tax=Planktothrix agardhii TaxID=1160 RepID=UPI0020B32C8D|nr:CHAT domain-containing tetratricopeptide repeat protein [Planktothrix agardhii]CAD5941797.1 Tetratricopeptide repeat protein 28 [Planktothrix agardhii]